MSRRKNWKQREQNSNKSFLLHIIIHFWITFDQLNAGIQEGLYIVSILSILHHLLCHKHSPTTVLFSTFNILLLNQLVKEFLNSGNTDACYHAAKIQNILNGCNITTFFNTIYSYFLKRHKKYIKNNLLSEHNRDYNTIKKSNIWIAIQKRETKARFIWARLSLV